MFSSTRTMSGAIAGLVALAGCAGLARAQCDIYRLDIHDFDQRRGSGDFTTGLPGNGSTYCTPTSACNWLAYIGSHGYPNVLHPRNWMHPAEYQPATDLIAEVGAAAGAGDGVGAWPTDVMDVIQVMLDEDAPGEFVCSVAQQDGAYTPSTEDIFDAMKAGQLVSFSTARWIFTPADIVQGLPSRYVAKHGGHTMSVSRVYSACSEHPQLWVRDPADPNDGVLTNQSVFRSKSLEVQLTPGLFADSATTSEMYQRTAYRCIDPLNLSKVSIIDALSIITAKCGLTANAQLGQISVQNMRGPDDLHLLPVPTHTTPNNAPIVGMRLLPQLLKAVVVTQLPGQDANLLMYSPADGTFDPIGQVPGATDLALGRGGEVYLAKLAPASRVVVRIDVHGGTMAETGTVNVPGAESLAYEDATDTVVCVAPSRRVLGFTSAARFGADYSEAPLPLSVQIAGQTSCAVWNGNIVLCSLGQNTMYFLTKTGPGTLVLSGSSPTTGAPGNPQFDHRGHLVFTAGGVVQEWQRNAAGGWEADPTSKFAGVVAGDLFEQMAARSMKGPVRGPGVLPCEIPNESETIGGEVIDCRADFDGNGVLQVADIFAYLNAWFAGSARADFGLDGTLAVQDIFDYLNAWFAGC